MSRRGRNGSKVGGTPAGNDVTFGAGAIVAVTHPVDCECRPCRRLRARDLRRRIRQTKRRA